MATSDIQQSTSLIDPSLSLDESSIKDCLTRSAEFKAEGNQHFSGKRWDEAIFAYRTALGQLPKREVAPSKLSSSRIGHDEEAPTENSPEPTSEPSETEEDVVRDTLKEECAKLRAVLNANLGACFMQLGKHQEVVEACTTALQDDPNYVKALQRRATSNDKLNTWSSLGKAQEDYNALLKLLPPTSSDITTINRALKGIMPRLKAAQEKETAEMLDKLKGIGNSILGNFGLSTDNFKFEPSQSGGYSVKFGQ